jgi:uncharacterized protein YjbI with pentapeptide repeats
MANPEHLAILKQGRDVWNAWREQSDERPDLEGAGLQDAYLKGVNLSGGNLSGATLLRTDLRWARLEGANLAEAHLGWARLHGAILTGADLTAADLGSALLLRTDLAEATLTSANLSSAHLSNADLTMATLTEANLFRADLSEADLSGASLMQADLRGADLTEANFTGANLAESDLEGAACVGTIFDGADLTGCRIYGLSAWDLRLQGATQKNLVITPRDVAEVTVDNLEVGQFMYLLLNNERIRHVIDTITSKVVLLLGRFTPERKVLLDALRDRLRTMDYSPVLFDFEKPTRRDLTETVRILAGLSRFVIADITDAKSIPQELMAIVPDLPSVPVQPLLLASQHEYAMFGHFRRYSWVLAEVLYDTPEQLVGNLEALVIAPAEAWVEQMKPSG